MLADRVVLLRRCVAGLLFLTLSTSAGSAAAREGDLERARALYDEAGELERRGQWAAAVEKLRAALEIRETPHLHYALGWALENDDKLLEARAEYEVAERTARGTAEDVEQLARTRRSELEAKTPNVRVVLGTTSRRARVVVDGREAPVRSGSVTVAVNPGTRVVRVEREGEAPIERIVYVARAETGTVDLASDLAPRPRPATSPSAKVLADAPAPAPERDRVVPWVLVGGGAALAAAGGALLVSSLGDAGDRDRALRAWCNETSCTGGNVATVPETTAASARRQEAEDAASRGNTKQTAAFVLGGAGLVAAAVGTYLFVRGDGRERTPPATSSRVRAFAAPTETGFAANATLTF